MCYNASMTREQIITALKKQQLAIEAKGVTSLYLFGSYARDDADEFSDVDVAIEYKRPFDLIDLVGFERMLENNLDLPVDVVCREDLGKMDERPENEVIQVF